VSQKKRRPPSKGWITCIKKFAPITLLKDENGNEVRLKQGAEVEVTVEAEPEATTPKPKKSPLMGAHRLDAFSPVRGLAP
jgi:hypothetical protein